MATTWARPSRRWLPVVATLLGLVGALVAHLAGLDPWRRAPGLFLVLAHVMTASVLAPFRLALHVASATLHPGQASAGAAALGVLLVALALVLLLRPATPVGWTAVTAAAVLGPRLLAPHLTLLYGPSTPWVLAGAGLGAYATRRGWTWVAAAGVAVVAVNPPMAIALALGLLAFGHAELVRRAVAVLAIAGAPLAVVLAAELGVWSASTQALLATSRVVPTLLLLIGVAVAAVRLARELGLTVA